MGGKSPVVTARDLSVCGFRRGATGHSEGGEQVSGAPVVVFVTAMTESDGMASSMRRADRISTSYHRHL
jgi:hypothetical protein